MWYFFTPATTVPILSSNMFQEKARIGILRSSEDNLSAKLANARAELSECQGNVSRVRASVLGQQQTEQVKIMERSSCLVHSCPYV